MRLGYLGESKLKILATLITRPWVIFEEASPEAIILYSLGLFLPFLALPDIRILYSGLVDVKKRVYVNPINS